MEAAARALFQQADEEMAVGDFAHACPRFEEVKQLFPVHINTGIKLAECYVGQGRPASAWAELSRVKAVAEGQQKADKVQFITERLAVLQVPQMTVDVPAEVAAIPGLVIRRNSVELGPGQWGVPLPVDPGMYHIEATAPGRTGWERRVAVVPKAAPIDPPVTVQIEAPPPHAVAASKQEGIEITRPVAAGVAPPPPSSGLRTAGIVGMGLGAAGLGVGAILGGVAIARNGQSNEGHCDAQDHCSRTGYALRKEALALGNGSTAAFVAGGVVLAVGVVLFARSAPAPAGKERDGRGGATMSLVIRPSELVLRGAW
ncbi:tetratricopeptide repeat protein [Polyangium sorediatum]|uniref:PEGA domain-containing protein n=1 Tax=Polyangium sorediatum TaxID=889274 RepID=A0ABT6NN14_9BACT|nr:hypothetical protein [Polyangium sorediatum]MDI1429694.1 hypothetical protein [Polyangium sorediatum]